MFHMAPPKFPATLYRLRHMNGELGARNAWLTADSDLDSVLRGYDLDTTGTTAERRARLKTFIGADGNEHY